jgi:hypothetical protein
MAGLQGLYQMHRRGGAAMYKYPVARPYRLHRFRSRNVRIHVHNQSLFMVLLNTYKMVKRSNATGTTAASKGQNTCI